MIKTTAMILEELKQYKPSMQIITYGEKRRIYSDNKRLI